MVEDKVFAKLLEHDKHFIRINEHFNQIEDKINKTVTRDEYLTGQDEVMTILRRLDQGRAFTTEWIRRIEGEITKIKSVLNIS